MPKLWREDPEVLWDALRYVIPPIVLAIAPSYAYGVDRVPLDGGAVLAANHFSALDHPLLGVFCPRPIHFFSKAELLDIPLVGEALSWTGAIPVRRGENDRAALRQACQLVRQRHVVGVHLEGTRQRFGHPGRMHSGGIVIALREAVPVVPCGIETFEWSIGRRRACAVVFGEPISLDRFSLRSQLKEARELVGAEIVRLWRQAAEAVSAGFPKELPDGTARSGSTPPGWNGRA